MNGYFVISLDFEKYWGVFDSLAEKNYQKNLLNVDLVVDRLLNLSKKYNVKLTFATVGFLFNKNKAEYLKNKPKVQPSYRNKLHNPYPLIDKIGNDQDSDPIYFGYNTLKEIISHKDHEIATHTYCHYYCLEEGQTIEQFESDLILAKTVAKKLDVDIKSIVFPRNQVDPDYLKVCKKNGIISYRGVENHTIYKPNSKEKSKKTLHRALRLADAYTNLTGIHTYNLKALKNDSMVDVPSSYFFRPYNKRLKFLEPLKIKRVKKGMLKASKDGEIFHLWFHPHNFGDNIEENFKNLEELFKTYSKLNEKYNFKSVTMSEMAERILNN